MSPLDQGHPHEAAVMSFGEHLDELRRRLFLALGAPILLAIGLFFVADTIVEVLCVPVRAALQANGLPIQLQVLQPAEMMFCHLKLSLVAAAVLSAPWILWQAWRFIQPGLHSHERRFVYFLLPGSIILTVSGLALLYWVMLPLMLNVLVGFGISQAAELPLLSAAAATSPGVDAAPAPIPILTEPPAGAMAGQMWIKMPEQLLCFALPGGPEAGLSIVSVPLTRGTGFSQLYRLSEYIDFVLLLALGVAIAFQMPLVIVLAGWVGLVEPRDLMRYRKHALFFCGIASAVITPSTDLVSMMMMMVPLYGLYELGLLLLKVLPASRIASGDLFPKPRFNWSYKRRRSPESSTKTAQPEGTIGRGEPPRQHTLDRADEEADP